MIGATLRNTLNPTVLDAGYKANVIPQSATAQVDGRFLPGHEEEFFATVDELLGEHVSREFVHHDIAVETDFDGPLVAAMDAALPRARPSGAPRPVLPLGRNGREVIQHARHQVLRFRAPEIAEKSGLLRNVSRHRRTRSPRRTPLRRTRSRPFSRSRLNRIQRLSRSIALRGATVTGRTELFAFREVGQRQGGRVVPGRSRSRRLASVVARCPGALARPVTRRLLLTVGIAVAGWLLGAAGQAHADTVPGARLPSVAANAGAARDRCHGRGWYAASSRPCAPPRRRFGPLVHRRSSPCHP